MADPLVMNPLTGGYSQAASSSTAADPTLFERLLGPGRQTKEALLALAESASKRPVGAYTTLGTAGLGGLNTMAGGNFIGGGGELVGGLVGGGLGQLGAGAALKAAGGAIPAAGPVALGLKIGLPLIGSLIGGGIGKQAASVGVPAAAQALGIPVPEELGARAKEQRARSYEREQRRLDYEAMSKAELARDKEYAAFMLPQLVEQEKALQPLREQMLRTQLINQQALNASNAALSQQLGRSATLGRFVLGQQEQAGATTRTLLSSNPYAGSVLQAPQISFG